MFIRLRKPHFFKRMAISLLVIPLAIFFITGCSAGTSAEESMDGVSQGEVGGISLSNSDVMFLQMMIPHHQQAVEISNLALAKSSNVELLDLAEQIATDQVDEIQLMRQWLKDAGEDEEMGHAMHGMDGMLTEVELDRLNRAAGSAFDQEWLEGMINHHEGALSMAEMVTDAADKRLRDFGERIITTQSQEITEMKAILAAIK